MNKVIGVAGFKNAGKTTLVEKLVTELTRRGHRISTVKHAHHSFDIDHEGRDSFRHRKAGAAEVAVVLAGYLRALGYAARGLPEIIERPVLLDHAQAVRHHQRAVPGALRLGVSGLDQRHGGTQRRLNPFDNLARTAAPAGNGRRFRR